MNFEDDRVQKLYDTFVDARAVIDEIIQTMETIPETTGEYAVREILSEHVGHLYSLLSELEE